MQMGYFSVGASEFLRRAVYPPFVALWSLLRNVTGRERRKQKAEDASAKAGDKRRHMDLWKESHDR
jgi:hypothetical protein